ncbi:MAG: metalloprotease [Candidatus Woesearchaeota archaeon]|jgi:Zn-dependent protease|nr:metalloprotease [Candidatus Woesearchaeota archaeon]MDP7505834.1 metalloprotease [Candidatus Woesearchaeota archaeon]MDP7610720.1 metalloprotease [Candidatus Woesearchaeota archaeon]|tara:strand:+ start:2436 stop:3056 length:621 start_codon:yes stop_codon:yes gene_type:complete
MYHKEQIKLGSFSTSRTELRDLAKAWIVISLAFAIAMSGFSVSKIIIVFFVSALTVGVAFLLHELAHKLVAQHYGCYAEFRSFDNMLILAIVMSFFGFVFAAPGAVMISGPVGIRKNGTISLAGPLVNLILALLCLIILVSLPFGILLRTIFYYGFMINTWIALFNLLPFGNFDGRKIFKWNRVVYIALVVVAGVFMIMQSFVHNL